MLAAIRDGRASLILPRPAVEELERVLRVKLGLDDQSIASVIALLDELAIAVANPPAEVPARSGDPADDRIIAAALAGDADVLVSGDRRHVLPLGRIADMRILRPQDLLAELAA